METDWIDSRDKVPDDNVVRGVLARILAHTRRLHGARRPRSDNALSFALGWSAAASPIRPRSISAIAGSEETARLQQ